MLHGLSEGNENTNYSSVELSEEDRKIAIDYFGEALVNFVADRNFRRYPEDGDDGKAIFLFETLDNKRTIVISLWDVQSKYIQAINNLAMTQLEQKPESILGIDLSFYYFDENINPKKTETYSQHHGDANVTDLIELFKELHTIIKLMEKPLLVQFDNLALKKLYQRILYRVDNTPTYLVDLEESEMGKSVKSKLGKMLNFYKG